MIKSGNGKHTNKIRKQRHPQCHRTPADHKNQQANNMHQDKGYHPEPVNCFADIIGFLYIAVIKPAQHLGNFVVKNINDSLIIEFYEYLKLSRVTVA